MAFEKGNQLASKQQRMWGDTLRKIATQDPDKIRKIAEKVIECAQNGESWAVQEIGNRLDGKPVQQVDSNIRLDNALARELSNEQLAIIAAGGTLSDGDGQPETLQ